MYTASTGLSEYELYRQKNIQDRRNLERTIFSSYYGKDNDGVYSNISRQIMEEVEGEDFKNTDEEDEWHNDFDTIIEDDGDIESYEPDIFSDQGESEQAEINLEDDEDSDKNDHLTRRCSQRLQQQRFQSLENLSKDDQLSSSSQYRARTPPPPEDEREEPWDFVSVEHVWRWREFSYDRVFERISQVGTDDLPQQHCSVDGSSSKRGPYKSTTTELDQMLLSKCTRRLVEWRRKMADGLSNESLDELLNILHDPECDINLLPHNHYHLEQLQDRALMFFKPKTTRWRIPKAKNDIESEEIIMTDIADLLRLQLQDPQIAQSIITDYNANDGIISHPSHCELWKSLYSYDLARDCRPLCLKVHLNYIKLVFTLIIIKIGS